ncbi:MAG: hypothetical protein ACPL06_02595 [Candidatus Anstonellales archaeon]
MKGQAAMEYLMTYGWAILLLVIVLSVLFASGIFTPSQFVREECSFTPDLTCLSAQLIDSGAETTLVLRIKNNFGYPIKLDQITYTTQDLRVSGEKAWKLDLSKKLNQGETYDITFTFRGNEKPSENEIKKINLLLTYYTCANEINPLCAEDPSYGHSISGKIVAKVLYR